jgi:TDG/mug DNA glycosylase family protein
MGCSSHCEREGSSYSSISTGDENDLSALYCACPRLKCLAFNGEKGASAFKKHRLPLPKDVKVVRLPSSSGALARRLEDKIINWREVLRFLE